MNDSAQPYQENLTAKPRVFLSHSKKDTDFIRRLDADLRRCLCQPWIDDIDIGHGRPWRDEIFGSGIPSCEVVLCYITPNSIASKVVQEEIDARLIEKLQDERVVLLPYVSQPDLRGKLRLDIQRLQTPVLNDDNYHELMPRLIAEIWRAHRDFVLPQAVQSERVRRLEAELALRDVEEKASADLFSALEQREFELAWSWLSTPIIGELLLTTDRENMVVKTHPARFCVAAIYAETIALEHYELHPTVLARGFQKPAATLTSMFGEDGQALQAVAKFEIDLIRKFLQFGFLERIDRPSANGSSFGSHMATMLTRKFDRFNLWLNHSESQKKVEAPAIELLEAR